MAGLVATGLEAGAGEADGEEVWPRAVKASAIVQREVKNSGFIGILCSEMRLGHGLDSKKKLCANLTLHRNKPVHARPRQKPCIAWCRGHCSSA
jgi:hypothetical protein